MVEGLGGTLLDVASIKSDCHKSIFQTPACHFEDDIALGKCFISVGSAVAAHGPNGVEARGAACQLGCRRGWLPAGGGPASLCTAGLRVAPSAVCSHVVVRALEPGDNHRQVKFSKGVGRVSLS